MFGFLALLLSGLTLLVTWAIAKNVNRVQAQLDRWEEEVNARLKELADQSRSSGPFWTAEVKHKGGRIEMMKINADNEGAALAQLLRQGIDPSRIRTLTRG